MKKIELKGRKFLRTMFGCISFTAVAFAFQACYGVREDYTVRLTGSVKSKTTKIPIKGINVRIDGEMFFDGGSGMTDEKGNFDFYASVPIRGSQDGRDSIKVLFLDIDSTENGLFADTTVFFINPARKDEVRIHVELEEKQ